MPQNAAADVEDEANKDDKHNKHNMDDKDAQTQDGQAQLLARARASLAALETQAAAQTIRAVEGSLSFGERDIDVWAAELDARDAVEAVEGGVDDSGCGAGGRESEAGEVGGGGERDGKGEEGAAANAGGRREGLD